MATNRVSPAKQKNCSSDDKWNRFKLKLRKSPNTEKNRSNKELAKRDTRLAT